MHLAYREGFKHATVSGYQPDACYELPALNCKQSRSDSAVERDGWRGWLHEATLCRKLDSIRRGANLRPRTASRAQVPCE